jgi:hypothetical protein
MRSQTAPPLAADPFREARRAELVFRGVEQAGPSFEGRVFLNNPDADDATALTPETGYAGSFSVYGYGEPPPPAVGDAQRRRGEGGPAVAPIEKRFVADPAAVAAALERGDELTVTVVAVPADPGGQLPERPFETLVAVFDRDG